MAQHGDKYSGLPTTWPFRAAGTVIIAAMSWFCLGFAIEDLGPDEHLANHLPVFWGLLLLAAVLIAGGCIYNIAQDRARRRSGG